MRAGSYAKPDTGAVSPVPVSTPPEAAAADFAAGILLGHRKRALATRLRLRFGAAARLPSLLASDDTPLYIPQAPAGLTIEVATTKGAEEVTVSRTRGRITIRRTTGPAQGLCALVSTH